MIKFSQHLSLGDSKDIFNVLSGIYENHEIDSILDCSPKSYASKWHKDKSVTLKKNTFKMESSTKQKLLSTLEYISQNHKEHKHVMLSSNKGYDTPANLLVAFLFLKKDKTIEEAVESATTMVSGFVPDESFVQSILKYKV